MEGMARQAPTELLPLARSWLQPPALEAVTDCRSGGYEAAQRACFLAATGPAPSFRLAASAEHPIHNPAFVARNWNGNSPPEVEIDGVTQLQGPALRQGITYDPNGRPMLVVWLQRESSAPARFTLRGAKPATASAETAPMRQAAAPRLVSDELPSPWKRRVCLESAMSICSSASPVAATTATGCVNPSIPTPAGRGSSQ